MCVLMPNDRIRADKCQYATAIMYFCCNKLRPLKAALNTCVIPHTKTSFHQFLNNRKNLTGILVRIADKNIRLIAIIQKQHKSSHPIHMNDYTTFFPKDNPDIYCFLLILKAQVSFLTRSHIDAGIS